MLLLMTAGAIWAALMMTLFGVALAQGGADVCVSNKGETKVQKGDSTCSSGATSHAVATKDSSATSVGFDNKASATNGSDATSVGSDCTAKAHNGEHVTTC